MPTAKRTSATNRPNRPKDEFLDYVREHPRSGLNEIAMGLGRPRETTAKRIRELEKAGKIEIDRSRKKWQISVKGEKKLTLRAEDFVKNKDFLRWFIRTPLMRQEVSRITATLPDGTRVIFGKKASENLGFEKMKIGFTKEIAIDCQLAFDYLAFLVHAIIAYPRHQEQLPKKQQDLVLYPVPQNYHASKFEAVLTFSER